VLGQDSWDKIDEKGSKEKIVVGRKVMTGWPEHERTGWIEQQRQDNCCRTAMVVQLGQGVRDRTVETGLS
jgi:hypothetical protein